MLFKKPKDNQDQTNSTLFRTPEKKSTDSFANEVNIDDNVVVRNLDTGEDILAKNSPLTVSPDDLFKSAAEKTQANTPISPPTRAVSPILVRNFLGKIPSRHDTPHPENKRPTTKTPAEQFVPLLSQKR